MSFIDQTFIIGVITGIGLGIGGVFSALLYVLKKDNKRLGK